jgi:hypothetical protein
MESYVAYHPHAAVLYYVDMPATVLCAAQAHLTPRKGMLVRTLDVGGAGPVAALLAAKHAIEHEGRTAVAIVAGDAVASVPVAEFLARADGSCRPKKTDNSSSSSVVTTDGSASCSSSNGDSSIRGRHSSSSSSVDAWVPSPVIPNLYDRVARWHMQQYGITREELVGGSLLLSQWYSGSSSNSSSSLLQSALAGLLNACRHNLQTHQHVAVHITTLSSCTASLASALPACSTQ